ncbi:LAFE_0F17920g1_1 [Lachancea fermentati]|uniref:LAFE_0F17920g1_1 n=1 Tax=Lachancea fermentati TaxID=4955 RepID=A0A1G4MGM3_LACFM|nr:LAFE_0F17920g1_1 [Lachancea fermentati]
MRQTAAKLAKSYTPMIKFVGTKHPIPPHASEIKAHPCTVAGMLPGSPECIPAGEFLSKLKPFKVVPFKGQGARNKVGENSNKAYKFTDRPLKEDEVASIFELPSKFHFRPIDSAEMDAINAGGAL